MDVPSNQKTQDIELLICCDSKTCYTVTLEMYTGKGSILAILLAAQYYCEKRRASIHVTHSHLTTENWFTSVRTEEQLLVKKLTVIGTFRKNKTGSENVFGSKN